jgi:hypothetical protein
MKNTIARGLCYRCGKYWLDLNTDEDLDPAVEYMSESEYLALPDKAREAWDNGEDVQYLAKMRDAKKAHLPLPDSFTFLKKLESYVFKSAQAYTANEFNQSFVQNFQY